MTTVASLRILLGLDSSDVRDGAGSVKAEMRGVQQAAKLTQDQFDALSAGLSSRIQDTEVAWRAARAEVERLKTAGSGSWTLDEDLANANAQAKSLGRELEMLENKQETLNVEREKVTAASAEQNRAAEETGRATEKLGEHYNSARTSIQRFATAGSQLALITSLLGSDFEKAAGPAAEFIRITGNAGLILSTTAELAPIAKAAVLELGTAHGVAAAATALEGAAAAAATPEIVAEGAAAATAAGGFSLLALAQNAAAIASGAAAAAIGILTAPLTLLVGAGVLLGVAIHEVATGFEDFHPKATKVASSLYEEVQAAKEAARATDELNRSTGEARIRAEEMLLQQLGLTRQLRQYEQALIDASTAVGRNEFATTALTGSAKDAATAAEEHRLRLIGETDELDATRRKFNEAQAATDELKASLDDLPSNIDINVNLNLNTASLTAAQAQVNRLRQTGEDTSNLNQFGGAPAQPFETTNFTPAELSANQAAAEAAAAARKKAEQAAEEARRKAAADAAAARRKAEQDARELAQAQIESGREAFDRLRDAAHKYFDDLHAQNLKAIDDARKAADELIEQQKRANQAPIDAARAAQKALADAREFAKLRADVANAQTPEELQAAQQALSDFTVNQAIDQQQAQADAANAALDTQKATQDAAFDAQKQAEDDRYKAQTQAFDDQLAALQKYLEKNPALWAKNTAAVIKQLQSAGVDYQAAGKANADAYLAGINAAFSGKGFVAADTGPTSTPRGSGFGANDIIGTPAYSHLGEQLARPSIQSQITPVGEYVGGGQIGDVYLDAEKVGVIIGRRQARLSAIYSRSGVSTGSKR